MQLILMSQKLNLIGLGSSNRLELFAQFERKVSCKSLKRFIVNSSTSYSNTSLRQHLGLVEFY